jgi:transcriptional regulator with XRE-family HTH domain
MSLQGRQLIPVGRRPEVDIQIGRNIRKQREAASMSTLDLSTKLGVPEAEILAWESGSSRVPAALFLTCARALNVPAQQLIAGLDDAEDEPIGPFDHLLF